MTSRKVELGTIFLIQTVVGILGNSFLFCWYSFTLYFGNNVRPTDLILNQLAIANFLVLVFKGIPQTMSALGVKDFLGNTGCKLVFYNHRLATGVSFSTICLLNGFQAIKINSSLCRWMALKFRSLKFIGLCCFLCWIPHIFLSSCNLIVVGGSLSRQNHSGKSNRGGCSWIMNKEFTSLVTILYFSPDFMSLGFMVWANGSIVLALYRHKQRVQHIREHRVSSRSSHEVRATCTVMILVGSFFTFYSVYTVMTVWMTLAVNPGQWSVNSFVLMASCFPAFSPFVLIFSDTRISYWCFTCMARKTLFANLVAMA
uniref:vomeronasal type-1 receptor 1 n=1 Tax=Jaculus jaculus TaxID=51337 RepID=UPI001E1B119A|nr:vomeronasal type-1 receptor 1 [Jaculus jaculus]XP_044990091.1 vomeronasal type-1 receptor 1-like [Jaculus jaculus]